MTSHPHHGISDHRQLDALLHQNSALLVLLRDQWCGKIFHVMALSWVPSLWWYRHGQLFFSNKCFPNPLANTFQYTCGFDISKSNFNSNKSEIYCIDKSFTLSRVICPLAFEGLVGYFYNMYPIFSFLFSMKKCRDIWCLYLTPRPHGIDSMAPCGTLLLCNLVRFPDMKKSMDHNKKGKFVNPSET